MKKPPGFVTMLLVAAVIGCLAGMVMYSREPAYGGRSLSQWVKSYSYSIDRGQYTPQQRENAIRGMGTNAVPYLMKWIQYETPPLKRRMHAALNPALKRIKSGWQLSDENEQLRADGAVFALISLSPNAEATIAELVKLADDATTAPTTRLRAANVLACIDQRFWKDPRTYRLFRQDPQ